ncbi:MAG TPA: protein kinase [Nakamurella sp.]
MGERYRIAEMIGRGGSAAVYRGVDTRLQRPVAVKIFHPVATDSRTMRRRRAEVDFLVRLNHPGLVTLLDAHIATDLTGPQEPSYLVMELIDGTSLEHRLSGGVLTASTTADIGRQLATALAAVHRSAMIHRDVKPANILLGSTGIAKLADFGIARLIDSARLTTTAEVMGTPRYLSPEQARGTQPGPATDIYSLGLVLLECLTGSPAFPGSAVESAMARLARNPALPESLPPAWVILLQRMTDPDPDQRPGASAVAAALTTLLPADHPARTATTVISAALPIPPPGPARSARTGRPLPGRVSWALSCSAAVLTVVVAAAVILWSDPTGGETGHQNRQPSSPTHSAVRPAAPTTTSTPATAASTDLSPSDGSEEPQGGPPTNPTPSIAPTQVRLLILSNAPLPAPATTITVTAAPPANNPTSEATTSGPTPTMSPTPTSGEDTTPTSILTDETTGPTDPAPTTAPTDPSTTLGDTPTMGVP